MASGYVFTLRHPPQGGPSPKRYLADSYQTRIGPRGYIPVAKKQALDRWTHVYHTPPFSHRCKKHNLGERISQ